jgi:hypothetical protein
MIGSISTPRMCRRCGRTPAEVRFKPLNWRICAGCQDIDDAKRAARLAGREPIAAPRMRQRPGECSLHLAWVRSHPCRIHGVRCGSIIHAHHVRAATGGGTGSKPDDRWAVPLWAHHHNEGHAIGWKTFEARYSVDLRRVAEEMAAASPFLPRPVEAACIFPTSL